jgi:hypothetical protein
MSEGNYLLRLFNFSPNNILHHIIIVERISRIKVAFHVENAILEGFNDFTTSTIRFFSLSKINNI